MTVGSIRVVWAIFAMGVPLAYTQNADPQRFVF